MDRAGFGIRMSSNELSVLGSRNTRLQLLPRRLNTQPGHLIERRAPFGPVLSGRHRLLEFTASVAESLCHGFVEIFW